MAGFYPDENDPLRRGFAGRMTWFNPKPWTYNDPATGRVWTDAQAQARREGAHASGLPINTPGFATAGREGLGHWYEVTLPDGRKYVTQKTDIGPTGVVDINAALASNAYPGGPETMPGGKASARYLGSKLPEGMTAGASNAPVTDMPFHRESSDSEDTAIASGPPQGRKMPEQPRSLMDMFQPTNALGEPTSFDQAIRDRSGSLIGMGMGLLNARGPGFGDALQGYMVGAQQDAQQGARRAQLQHQKSQDARQAREDAFARERDTRDYALRERQFERSDPNLAVTDAQKAMRDVLGPDATPEQKSAFMRDYYRPKTEGNLVAQAEQRRAIAQANGLDENEPKVKSWIASGGTLNEKPRDMSVADITKLSEEGGKLSSLGSFGNTFEPRFAGYKASMLGEAANLAGRNVPGLVSQDVKEGATWWQGYDQYKNTIRHELYGGALTPTEVAVFEKAQINPGMNPEQIKKNLTIQRDVVQNGIKRKANAMIAAGYDPATIANAYGVNLKDIGVTATGRGSGGASAATTAPPAPAAPATPKVEQRKTHNGKSYSKINGEWYED